MRFPFSLRRKVKRAAKRKGFRNRLTEAGQGKKGVDYTGKHFTKDSRGIMHLHNSPVAGSKPLIDARRPAEQNVDLPAYKTNIQADRETNLKMNWIRNEEVNVVDNPTVVKRTTADQRYANNPENIERKISEIKQREKRRSGGKKRYKFDIADKDWRERRQKAKLEKERKKARNWMAEE